MTRLKPAVLPVVLSQTLLRCTVRGVPDFYQSNGFNDLHRVDPDNRSCRLRRH
jgi:maltooligosyltrehalose synthase